MNDKDQKVQDRDVRESIVVVHVEGRGRIACGVVGNNRTRGSEKLADCEGS